jgi:hypothetical protein
MLLKALLSTILKHITNGVYWTLVNPYANNPLIKESRLVSILNRIDDANL